VGWCLAFDIYSGLLLGPAYLLVGLLLEGRPQPVVLLTAAVVSTFVVGPLLTLRALGDEVGRVLAVRRPSLLHVALVVLLAPPQALLAVEAGNWAAEVFPLADDPASPPAPEPDAASSAGAGLFRDLARMFEDLAHQPWWLILPVGCLLPALGEEAFFRGFLGRGFVARAGPVGGVLLTSLLFGLMHLHPHQACATAVLGVSAHLVFLTARSFWAPVLLHALHNALVFGTVRLAQQGDLDLTGQYAAGHLPLGTVLAAGAATALLWHLLYATRTRWLLEGGQEWSPGYVSAESPPAGVAATPWVPWPGSMPVAAAAAGCLVFAATALFQAEPPGPLAARYWSERGMARLEKGESDEAIAAFTRAIRLDPADAYAHANRGLARVQQGKFAEAIPDLDAAIRLDPGMADAYLNRGVARARLEDHDAAIADYTEAIRLNPDWVLPRANRGLAHLARGDQERALADLTEAIRREPSAQHHLWRGQAYLAKGHLAPAGRDFTEAIRLDPGLAEAYYQRGLAFEGAGDKARAEMDFQEAVRLDPNLAARGR
jgi:tetratricopeptide (TPR) repeat protein/membrane protease YdiL (CAAX protease family)